MIDGKDIERLARDICWAGFSNATQKAHPDTKVSYWKRIAEDTRRDYIREAERFVWLLKRLGKKRIAALTEDRT